MLSEIFLSFKRKTWQLFDCGTFSYFVFLYSPEFFKFHSVRLYLKQRFGWCKVLFLNKRLHTTAYDSIKGCLVIFSPSHDSVDWKPLVKLPIPNVLWLCSGMPQHTHLKQENFKELSKSLSACINSRQSIVPCFAIMAFSIQKSDWLFRPA